MPRSIPPTLTDAQLDRIGERLLDVYRLASKLPLDLLLRLPDTSAALTMQNITTLRAEVLKLDGELFAAIRFVEGLWDEAHHTYTRRPQPSPVRPTLDDLI